jgi:hypothetical protein
VVVAERGRKCGHFGGRIDEIGEDLREICVSFWFWVLGGIDLGGNQIEWVAVVVSGCGRVRWIELVTAVILVLETW